jgi:hypothetical protein
MDRFSGAHLVTGPHALPVDKNRPVTNCPLHFGPRGILHVTGQKEIKPLFLFPGRDNDVEDGVQE